MPIVYVTYRDPQTDAITTTAVETALSFRVFRLAVLTEGLDLPDGRGAVLPALLRGVSLDPLASSRQPEPAAAKRKRQLAAAGW